MPCRAKVTLVDPDTTWGIPSEIHVIHCNQQDDHTGDHTASFYEAEVRWTQ